MILGLAITAAVMAAEKRPDVTIISMKKYEIVVDGKTYFSNSKVLNIDNLRNGRHTIKVYEMSPVFSVFKRKQLVANKTFLLKGNDMKITIDRFGHLDIQEQKFGRDNRYDNDRRGRDDHDNRKTPGKRF